MSDNIIQILPPGEKQKIEPKTYRTIEFVGIDNPLITTDFRNACVDFIMNIAIWCWFCHFTFADFLNEFQANRHFFQFLDQLSSEVFGTRNFRRFSKGVGWVRATERQQRGATHFHALIANIPDSVQRFHYMNDWLINHGGYARIYPYDPTMRGARYMTKYLLKGGQIDFGGDLSKYNPPIIGQV